MAKHHSPSLGAVTLKDVAREAGTSPAAVSRAINGRSGVRPEVREAVARAVRDLGYVPHPAARSLAMQRTGLIALVIGDVEVIAGTEFFSSLVTSVVTELDDLGLQTVLLLPRGDKRYEQVARVVRAERLDGAVIVGHRSADPLVKRMAQQGVPLVALGRPVDLPAISYVDLDNVGAGSVATDHLANDGRDRIGILTGPLTTSWAADRLVGYTKSQRARGTDDPDLVEHCELSASDGYTATMRLLTRRPDLNALLVASEALLPGALSALEARNRGVPDEVALVAFDDGPTHLYNSPPVTAVKQPLPAIGAELARLMADMLKPDAPLQHRVFDATLHVRGSSRRRETEPDTA
jgi:DNA-binding LacI/PurR family transcriptional regulator